MKGKPYLKLIEAQARQAMSSIWVADGMMHESLQNGGIYDRTFPTPRGVDPRTWQFIMRDKITRMLSDAPLTWSVWFATFETDGERTWVSSMHRTLPRKSSNELSDDVHNMLERHVASRNKKHVISYGWFATPMKDVDLNAMHDDIVDRFTRWGAFNKELCNLANLNRKLREGQTGE